MKSGIHPDYKEISISCVCGNTIETGSVKENIRVEICSACHPFYAGTQKIVDTEGRIDKFKKRYDSIELGKKSAKKIREEQKIKEEAEKRLAEKAKEQEKLKALKEAKKESKLKAKERAKAAEDMKKQLEEKQKTKIDELNKQEDSKEDTLEV